MSENAPRPWNVVKINTQWWCVLDANADLLADTLTETDARLIADAPALAAEVEKLREALEAVERLRKRLPDPDFGEQETTARAIGEVVRDALAKRGEEGEWPKS